MTTDQGKLARAVGRSADAAAFDNALAMAVSAHALAQLLREPDDEPGAGRALDFLF
jgi:hypothetical protein